MSATSPLSYAAGPASASGTITDVRAGRILVSTISGDLEVVFTGAVSIWKETEVTASALELGDQVSLNGTRSGPIFEARHIWVNIGRFDGVVRAFDGITLDLIGHAAGANAVQIELSQYLEVVRGNGIPATTAEIKPGIVIGGVLYRPKSGLPRATRVWLP